EAVLLVELFLAEVGEQEHAPTVSRRAVLAGDERGGIGGELLMIGVQRRSELLEPRGDRVAGRLGVGDAGEFLGSAGEGPARAGEKDQHSQQGKKARGGKRQSLARSVAGGVAGRLIV